MNTMLNDSTSYFAYIDINGKQFYLKGMRDVEVIKRVMMIKRGDILNIRDIGTLRVANIFFKPHWDMEHLVKEIGIYCNKIKA